MQRAVELYDLSTDVEMDEEDMEVFAIVRNNPTRVALDKSCVYSKGEELYVARRRRWSFTWAWYILYGVILASFVGVIGIVGIGSLLVLCTPSSQYFWPVLLTWMIAVAIFILVNNIKEDNRKCQI